MLILMNVGDCVFMQCEKVSKIVIPEGVVSIGQSAFSSCKGITEIKLPETLESVGENAFSSCPKLTSITFPANVKEIGNYVISNDKLIKSVTVLNPECNIYSGKEALANDYDKNMTSCYNGIIYGYNVSTAHDYADAWGYEFVAIDGVMGDVNADGVFNAADAVLLQSWIISVPEAELANWRAGDFDSNGRLDTLDLTLMKKALSQKI